MHEVSSAGAGAMFAPIFTPWGGSGMAAGSGMAPPFLAVRFHVQNFFDFQGFPLITNNSHKLKKALLTAAHWLKHGVPYPTHKAKVLIFF